MEFEAELLTIISEIISATVRPDLWPEICDRIASYFDATAFMVFEYDFETFGGQIFRTSSEIMEKGAHLIEATLRGVPKEEMAAYALMSAVPAGKLISEYQLYRVPHDTDMPPNPFRDEVLAMSGALSRNVARTNDVGPWADIAALHLPVYGADMALQTRERMNILIPVIGKAFEANRMVRALTRTHGAMLDALDHLDFGAAIVDAGGRIAVANRAFRDLASDRDGLTETGGVVGAVRREDTAGLIDMIQRALDPATPATRLVTSLRRSSGGLPLVAKAAPLRSPDLGPGEFVLLLVVDPEDEARLTADGLDAFGLLTAAELDVCTLLLRGAQTEEIAERRSTALETTRNQIKSASSKLACKSRLDLVRLAMATRAPVRRT